MCPMCEGKTEEEMLAIWAGEVDRDGWMPLHVQGTCSWTYTLGLRWSFDHPELIVTHADGSKATDLLGHAVDEIRAGRRFSAGARLQTPCGASARFGVVHHGNLVREWFARWPQVAAMCGHGTTSLRAVQAIVDCCSCVDCASQVLLDRPCSPATGRPVHRRRPGR